MGRMIPDPYRRWVKGTAYPSVTDETSKDGTVVGVGTIEIIAYGRACGITYASPVSYHKEPDLGDLFLQMFGD